MIEDIRFAHNPPSVVRDMVTLLTIPPRTKLRRLTLRVTLDETKRRGDNTMRCVFATELKVDIDTTDDALKKAFLDLILSKAREAYGVAGMLAKGSPIMVVSMTTREGKEIIPLFDAPVRDEDDDGE